MKDTAQIKELFDLVRLQNDELAYKALFIKLHKSLCQFAYGILKSQQDAQDVVSDVFITIWEKRNQLTDITSPLAYCYTAVKNRSLNILKQQKRQKELDNSEWLVPQNSVYFNPENLMMTEEIIQQIRLAIQNLPSRCRLIFKLTKDDGLKYKEVAELLNISVKTVEAQMAIAMRRLAKCMPLNLTNQASKSIKK
jgi:RNA polymerase sigma-70 factor (family 1)